MNYAKLIGGFVLTALIGFGLWYLYHTGYQAGKNETQVQWDADKIKRDEAQKQALIAYANRTKQAEDQHDADQATIDRLAAIAVSLRIHMPACPGVSASAIQDPNGTSGILQSRVDRQFAEFKGRIDRLVARCDQLNIDAQEVNKALGY
jgi:hypothetical protein